MDPNVLLPLASSVVSFVFAAFVADQWLERRRAYQLVWMAGLVWYGIGAGTEFIGGAFGWNEALYRAWYLFGAFGVAAYLGLGTIYLLNRTRFGYFVAASFTLAGLFSWLTAVKYASEGTPAPGPTVVAVVGTCVAAAVAIAVVTRLDRRAVAHLAGGLLVVASAVVAWLTLTVPTEAPGFSLTATGIPTGDAMPAGIRILTPPFNIVGAFSLVFGAVYSAYIFMPKARVMRVTTAAPLIGPLGRGIAVVVNFVASLPGAVDALRAGRLNSRVPATVLIAIGGFIPGWTSGLSRFGVTWSFFIGELLGVLFIFAGFLVSIEVFSDVRLPFTRIVLVRRDRRARAADVVDSQGRPA